MISLPIAAESACPEWVTLEFQGDIECFEQQFPGHVFQIGAMGLSKTKKDTIELTIGYHLLEGKSEDLKKPLAMLEKVVENIDGETRAAGYKVVGLIRKKIIFKARPKTLISKPQPRSGQAARKL